MHPDHDPVCYFLDSLNRTISTQTEDETKNGEFYDTQAKCPENNFRKRLRCFLKKERKYHRYAKQDEEVLSEV